MLKIENYEEMSRMHSLYSTMDEMNNCVDRKRENEKIHKQNYEKADKYDYSKSADSYGISASSSYEIRNEELNDKTSNVNLTSTESNESENLEDNSQGEEKVSKKPRTNYRDPRRLANIKSAIDLLLQQEGNDGESSRKTKNLKEVSRQFNIPYNTLRDNFLRTTTGQVRHSSVKQVLKTRKLICQNVAMQTGMSLNEPQIIPMPMPMGTMMQLQDSRMLHSHQPQQQIPFTLGNGSFIYCAMPYMQQQSNIIHINQLTTAQQQQNPYSHNQQVHLMDNGHNNHSHTHISNMLNSNNDSSSSINNHGSSSNDNICFMNNNGVYYTVRDRDMIPEQSSPSSMHSFRSTPQQFFATNQQPHSTFTKHSPPSSASDSFKDSPDSDEP